MLWLKLYNETLMEILTFPKSVWVNPKYEAGVCMGLRVIGVVIIVASVWLAIVSILTMIFQDVLLGCGLLIFAFMLVVAGVTTLKYVNARERIQ
jgi:hypothetical protein